MNDVSGESHSAISSFLRLSATGKVPGPKEVGLCRGTQGDIFLKKSRLVGCFVHPHLVHPHVAGFSTARPYFLGFLVVKFVSFSFRDVWEPDATFAARVGFHTPLWKAQHLLVSPTWNWIVYVRNHIWSILFQFHLSFFYCEKTNFAPFDWSPCYVSTR